jgi:PHD/YefM family antitoxin component YafN of YafNO toxin-antitoxin module
MSIAYFGGFFMPVMRESTDLKNDYSEISQFCHKYREPIFITENGTGDLAVMSIETYEEITGIRELIKLLEEADNEIENGNFISEEEMDRRLDLL